MKARRLSWQRGAALALAAGLAFVLVGDRARAGLIPGVGIDPLEVMDLQVKPNVIIVLDSSGSMSETVTGPNTTSGDHPRSKLGLAKSVLTQLIANNDKKASFMFGQYTSNATQSGTGRGGDRWLYGTDSLTSPSMVAQEIVLDYHAFQTIAAPNNVFVFGEEIAGNPSTESVCQFTVAPGFYTPGVGGGTMAQALQNGMNAPASCTVVRPTPNAYTVTWNAGSRRFDYQDTGGGTHRYRIRWGSVAPVPTIRQLITNNVTATPGFTANGGTYNAGVVLRLSRRDTSMKFNDTVVTAPGPPPVTATATFYNLISTRFWNGQTLHVLPPPSLDVCDITNGAPGDGSAANPWYFNVAVRNTCASASGTPVKFTFFGSFWGGNNISCHGYQPDVPLIPCDQTTPTQVSTIAPFLQPQAAVTVGNTATTCAGVACPIVNYQESTDGTFTQVTGAARGGLSSAGSTPIIQTILDIQGSANNMAGGARPQRGFSDLWFNGQAAVPGPAITPISTHPNPKERTILLFITDGDPTCDDPNVGGGGVSNNLALGSAWAAEQAFKRLDPAEATSSLSTYFVAFGNGASVTRANWIAWGGSGFTSTNVASINGGVGAQAEPSGTVVSSTALVTPTGTDLYIRWAGAGPTAADKAALCPACIDAFIAPDAGTLIAQLESILNQGASTGEFSAQQSVTSNVYEYTNLIVGVDSITGAPFDPANPTTRLVGFVPTRFVSTFAVPGFQGQFRAFTDVNGDGAVDGPGPNGERWSAGDKLVSLVATGRNGASGMNACSSSGTPGECTFLELHANASDSTLAASAAAIKRRIYTTSGNGSFGLTAQDAINRASPGRVELWPPDPTTATTVAPNSNTAAGLLDSPLTLPTGTLTAADFTALQTKYHACKGIGVGGVPVDAAGSGHPCSATNAAATRAGRARREAREMILAFLAGGKFVPDAAGDPKRLTTGTSEILFSARGWLLAEGTLSTPAVVAPPVADNAAEVPAQTVGYDDEYRIFRDGVREAAPAVNPLDAIDMGLGLRNPDRDANAPADATGKPLPDPREDLKPVMTVVYAGTNLMLHAFRAGPCTASTTCTETGGEELWAYVPYDQVGKITSRYLNDPQPRNPHDFVIAASLRFGDVFVPIKTGDPDPLSMMVGTVDANTFCDVGHCDGVWRRILYVGRGFGGKYWTALDVTGPGRYTKDSLSTNPPLVYWSRGNPDTVDGTVGGTAVNTPGDLAAYATMGQTWSVPAVNFVDKAGPSGVNFILNMGSGFSDVPAEGHDFYTVDALTGNMIAHVDVDAAATSIGQGLPRATPPFPTALVANAAGFSKGRFFPGIAFHPAFDFTTRNYFGDVQGRLWKVLVSAPGTAIPVADIGADQPLGTPLGLFGLLGTPGAFVAASSTSDLPNLKPTIFGGSGNDNRIPLDPNDPIPQFRNFALFDTGSDTDVSPGTAVTVGTAPGIRVFGPNTAFLFDRVFDPDSNFRGTLQPTTAALDKQPVGAPDGKPDGVVAFFGGTRFNPIGSPFVIDPCRSTFDSIVFAFDINTGGAAFDLQSADDTYTIFQDSRLVGIFTTYSPDTGSGGKLVLDEGLVKGTVQPPPPAGQPAGTASTNYSVVQRIRPNSPLPGVRFGSTVCQ